MGLTTEKSLEKARQFYKKSCDLGFSDACEEFDRLEKASSRVVPGKEGEDEDDMDDEDADPDSGSSEKSNK